MGMFSHDDDYCYNCGILQDEISKLKGRHESPLGRSWNAINLKQFNNKNYAEFIEEIKIIPPDSRQYILRMLIKKPFQSFKIPETIEWTKPLIDKAFRTQESVGIRQPYCYITIRSGLVESVNDDAWHVDGFSTNITHLPEQNYCWSNIYPTEFVVTPIKFPVDFLPMKHNIHLYIQDYLDDNNHQIITPDINTLVCFDPYVIHRRPHIPFGIKRTFVRISFTPIEIIDDSNTQNSLIPTSAYGREGVRDFRDGLKRYNYIKRKHHE